MVAAATKLRTTPSPEDLLRIKREVRADDTCLWTVTSSILNVIGFLVSFFITLVGSLALLAIQDNAIHSFLVFTITFGIGVFLPFAIEMALDQLFFDPQWQRQLKEQSWERTTGTITSREKMTDPNTDQVTYKVVIAYFTVGGSSSKEEMGDNGNKDIMTDSSKNETRKGSSQTETFEKIYESVTVAAPQLYRWLGRTITLEYLTDRPRTAIPSILLKRKQRDFRIYDRILALFFAIIVPCNYLFLCWFVAYIHTKTFESDGMTWTLFFGPLAATAMLPRAYTRCQTEHAGRKVVMEEYDLAATRSRMDLLRYKFDWLGPSYWRKLYTVMFPFGALFVIANGFLFGGIFGIVGLALLGNAMTTTKFLLKFGRSWHPGIRKQLRYEAMCRGGWSVPCLAMYFFFPLALCWPSGVDWKTVAGLVLPLLAATPQLFIWMGQMQRQHLPTVIGNDVSSNVSEDYHGDDDYYDDTRSTAETEDMITECSTVLGFV